MADESPAAHTTTTARSLLDDAARLGVTRGGSSSSSSAGGEVTAISAARASPPVQRAGPPVVMPGQQQQQRQAPVVVGGGSAAGQVRRSALNAIIVSVRQKGNPLLTHLKGVAWEYGDIVADYQVGAITGVLYLSLKYHQLHPEYLHTRIEALGQTYGLRVLVLMCDITNHEAPIRELTRVCLGANMTIMVCWDAPEAARTLALFKTFEKRPPDLIKERVDSSHMAHLTAALTAVKGINKTDVTTLTTTFGTLKNVVAASYDELLACPGLGDKKVRRLRETFDATFNSNRRRQDPSQAELRSQVSNQLN